MAARFEKPTLFIQTPRERYPVELVGGKGLGLIELEIDGEAVPPFNLITTDSFDAHMDQLVQNPERLILLTLEQMSEEEFEDRDFMATRVQIREFLKDLNRTDPTTIRAFVNGLLDVVEPSIPKVLNPAAAIVRLLIEGADLPEAVKRPIKKEVDKDPDRIWFFRSSGTAEDLEGDASAGMQDSVPAQGFEDCLAALKRCMGSLYTFRAWNHRDGHFDQKAVGLATVMQHLVSSEAAGVVMTVQASTSNPDRVTVSAVHGQGEGLVSGKLKPWLWEVDKSDWSIIKKVVHTQRRMMKATLLNGSVRNRWVSVPASKVGTAPLTDDQVVELAKSWCGIATKRGHEVDGEFSLFEGRIYNLQDRPISVDFVPYEEDEGVETAELLLEGESASPHTAFGRVRRLTGPKQAHLLQKGEILVAPFTDPTYGSALNLAAGIITREGGPTSHGAIISRQRKKAGVVGVDQAMRALKDGMEITVVGRTGKIYLGKAEAALKAYRRWQITQTAKTAALLSSGITTRTQVMGIVASREEAEDLVSNYKIDGTGLVRMEHALEDLPHAQHAYDNGLADWYVNELTARLEGVVRAFEREQEVTVRFPDLREFEFASQKGGRKYRLVKKGPNLDMHIRGLRHYLMFPDATRLYVRVFKNLAGIRPIKGMAPFLDTVENAVKVHKMFASFGLPDSDNWSFGGMFELPATMVMADEFFNKAGLSFGSIGSNDLTMFTGGADRNVPMMRAWFSEMDPAVLKLCIMAIKAAHANGAKMGICGNGPSDFPEFGRNLIRAGIDSISVLPDAINTTWEIVIDEEAAMRAEAEDSTVIRSVN